MQGFLDIAGELLLLAREDGTVVNASASWESVLGHLPADLIGRSWRTLVHPDDVGAAGDASQFQARLRHASGSHRYFSGRQRRRDQAVYLAFAPFEATTGPASRQPGFIEHIVAQLPALMWTIDRKLVFTASAGAGLKALGISPGQVIGTSLFDYFGTRDPEFHPIACHRRALEGHSSTYELPWADSVWSTHLEPLVDENHRVVGAIGLALDVTAQKRVELELRTSQRLQSLGVLAGGIAHDFNNVLTMVLANVSLARRRARGDGVLEAILADVEQASQRASGLTGQLLTFSRGGAPLRKPAQLGPLVRSTAEFALRGGKSRCDVDIAPDLALAQVDEGQISQVLGNLMLNASEAMPDGGTVTVSARNRVLELDDVARLPPGRYIEIEVRDQGVGILPQHLERVFDPFFSTKERGSGLGLATAHGIVERHDGRIAVTSRPGEGTVVSVLLPASADGAGTNDGAGAGAETTGGAAPGRRARVLIMDDEPSIRVAASRLLVELGYDAEVAADGGAAITAYERAQAAAVPFDLVILDLVVPGGLGGVDTLRLLRELDPEVRAIVSSGYAADAVLAEHAARGFVGALPKPYRIERLAQLLEELLGGARR